MIQRKVAKMQRHKEIKREVEGVLLVLFLTSLHLCASQVEF